MNIKSLLLGSAAALAVVSGAQAADAVVAAEPEPVEYVKVCDAYGTGYFYIPGTETCLKVGGRVRFDVKSGDFYRFNSSKGWETRSRAELYLDSASDTEYGALKTQMIARWDFDGTYYDGAHTNPVIIAANIQLAGLLVGQADSLFSTFTGYAGNVNADDVIAYGDFEINQISYTYDNGTGFTAAVGLQDDREAIRTDKVSRGGATLYHNGHDYAPDFIAGAGYNFGNIGLKVIGGYDESEEDGVIKARLDGTFGSISAFIMGAWSSSKGPNAFAIPDYSYGIAWGHWAGWAGGSAQLADNLKANLQVATDDNNTWAIAANVQWNPVAGLLIQPEVTYSSWDLKKSPDKSLPQDRRDQWTGLLRFERTF